MIRWKVFKKTQTNLECKIGCLCDQIVLNPGKNLQETVIDLISSVPSSLDKKGKNVFDAHFQDFIDYIKYKPDQSFYPQKDY